MKTPNSLFDLHLQHTEGMNAATKALASIALTKEAVKRTDILADAMGDLIDFPLCFNNLDSTRARLCGFSKILAEKLDYQPFLASRVTLKDIA